MWAPRSKEGHALHQAVLPEVRAHIDSLDLDVTWNDQPAGLGAVTDVAFTKYGRLVHVDLKVSETYSKTRSIDPQDWARLKMTVAAGELVLLATKVDDQIKFMSVRRATTSRPRRGAWIIVKTEHFIDLEAALLMEIG